jgi:small subunit ribosomal protein S6
MQKELELYEILYLIKPNFTEQEIKEKIDFYQGFLTDKGSQVMVQNRGKRSLSYPISGFDTANYVQLLYLGNGNLVKTLNQRIQRDESVLRHITTKLQEPIQ